MSTPFRPTSVPTPLPVPTPDEVRSFQVLYEQETGVRLNAEQAEETATRLLQLFCLGLYGLPTKHRDETQRLSP